MNAEPGSSCGESKVGNRDGSVTAIIVTFNSKTVIDASLAALQDCPAVHRIIVVDNASSDGTVALIAERFPNVEIIGSPENLGFGRANNLGLHRVETDFAFVLNPDVVVTPQAISGLLSVAASRPTAAIIGPKLACPSRRRETFRTGSVWKPRRSRIPDESDIDVDFVSGAAMFMRMSLFRSRFFDPDIFLFYEDDDLCLSAKRAGYSLVLTSKAVVSHLVGQSTPPEPNVLAFKKCHFTWSRLYLEEKELGRPLALKLARQMLWSISRKQWFANLTRAKSKQHLLKARAYAVQCFLSDQLPLRNPDDFLSRIALSTNTTTARSFAERRRSAILNVRA